MMLTSIFEGILGLSGSPFGVGVFVLVFLVSLVVLKGLNYVETWFVIIITVGAFSSDYGGGYLPEWMLVIVLVPFGWVLAEIIIKRWQGQTYN